MKTMKKVLALLVAVLMIAASVSALAETKKITINDTVAGYTYKAFQVFSGDLSTDGNTLSNIQWGNGINGDNLLTALQADATFNTGTPATNLFAGKTTAKDVAEVIGESTFTTEMATRLALLAGQNTKGDGTTLSRKSDNSGYEATVDVGYYLVKNTGVPAADEENQTGAYTNIILKVVGDATATPKRETVTVDKKVGEKDDSTDTGATAVDDEYADYDVGDLVPFKLTATTAANTSSFKKYHVTFVDTQSGFKAPTSFTVKVGSLNAVTLNSENSWKQEITDTTNKIKTTVEVLGSVSASTFSIKVTFESTESGAVVLGAYNSQTITVDYVAELDSSAVRGNPGNPNKVKLVFSNNPNSTDDSDEGETPEETVVVFTYDMDFDKLKKNDGKTAYEALNAGFTLYKKYAEEQSTGTNVAGTTVAGGTSTTFPSNEYWYAVGSEVTGSNLAFGGLDAGVYKLLESTTPNGYNTMEPLAFEITRTIVATTTADTDLPNGYKLTVLSGPTGWQTNPGNGKAGTEGQIDLGFMRPTADGTGNETVTTKIDGTTTKLNSGEIFGQIVNEQGTQLPSTGGIGTTLFYIGGSILVLAAVILLVTKRRMGSDE